MEWVNNNTVLMGDFNAHQAKWSIGVPNGRGLELSQEASLHHIEIVVKKNQPTLLNKSTKKLGSPDLILISHKISNNLTNWKLGDDVGSDHLPIQFNLRIYSKPPSKVTHKRKHWILSNMDNNLFQAEISRALGIHNNISEGTINQACERWTKRLLEIAEKICPRHKNLTRRKSNPWWNASCELLFRKRSIHRHKLNKYINPEGYLIYTKLDKAFKKEIRKAKRKYWEDIYKRATLNDTFKMFRRLKGGPSRPNEVKAQNGDILTSEKAISNEICRFFSSCGRNIRVNKNSKKITEQCIDNEVLNRPISLEEVAEIISSMKERKAPGIDDVSPFMIKRGGNTIVVSITKLFNRIYSEGRIPQPWFVSRIIPIPKKTGRSLQVNEFRPISLLPVTGKILEKLINKRLTITCEKLNWLPNFQKGFRAGKSTLDNLILLQQEIHTTFKKKQVMIAAFLDIKKAYDCVCRPKLVQMLEDFGLEGKVKAYLKDFLTAPRSGRVAFGEHESDIRSFPNGVPQGSPLSPLLFNIYMSKLKEIEDGSKISQFADDLVIWERAELGEVAVSKLQKRIKALTKWADRLGLQFSPDKCVAIKFTRKRKHGGYPSLKIKGVELKYGDSAKYLGVIWDKGATWKYQIKQVITSANKRVGILSFMSKHNYRLNQKIMITLYKTLVRPVLEYASEVWGDASPTNLKKLDSVQHQALTKCLGVNRLAHKKDVNFEACVLPLELRRYGKIINTGSRMRNTSTMMYLESIELRDRLMEKRRSSFLEKLKQTQDYLHLDNNRERRLSKSELNNILKREWTRRMNAEWRADDRQACYQNIKTTTLIYTPISRKRKINSAWHQARLGVTPTKAFLFSIGKKSDNKCPRCKVTDNLNHMLSTCSRYRTLWMKMKMNRKPEGVSLGTFLGLDRPPPVKQKISRIIRECFRWNR
jgi:hypothetical protein